MHLINPVFKNTILRFLGLFRAEIRKFLTQIFSIFLDFLQ
ncbi:hypothetical protein HAL07_06230 [Helicobacter ailurogastricus]|uniref:Uncharacterized protein n=1 Tax=Helicobacter ailurogastricus TaxID=1578720 RepID=A0A0K2Y6F9_9HELI|nr:hypothetical protein HAL07_06230 [Helicobacter ailurogastricus]